MESTESISVQHDRAQKRKRKNKMGRSSRRRQAKIKDIQKAEERIWNGDSIQEVAKTSVPTDRDKVWPGVLERRGENGLTSAEEAALVGQLGYLPGNAICVAARAQHVPLLPVDDNVPIVLKLYPLAIRDAYAGGKSGGRKFKGRRRGKSMSATADNETAATDPKDEAIGQHDNTKEGSPLLEPFPTHYWLTHPILRTLTSKLELSDHVRVMEERLRSDPKALESMHRAHHAYGQQRWESLTEDDLNLVKKRKWEPALDSRRGVAGITRPTTIKCLHTHLAHYLSGGRGCEDNVVGKWVLESLTKTLQERNSASETANKQQDKSDASK